MLFPFLLCILILYVPPSVSGPAPPWPIAVGGVCVLMGLNAIAGWLTSSLAIRLGNVAGLSGARAANGIFAFLKGCLIGFVLADVVALGWPAWLDAALADGGWLVLARDFVLLLPALAMVLTTMAFQYRFERRHRRVALRLGPYLWLRFRVELAIILAPWLALVVVSSVVALAFEGSAAAPLADGLATGAVLLALVVFSPALLRAIWATSPLPPGPLRARLEAFCAAHRFRCREILVWHTHRHLANAGVAGPTPLLRYVMLTDALLQNCTDEEVEGVFAHEVGHVRHRHLPLFLLFGAAFICFYANLVDLLAAAGIVDPLGDLLALNMSGGQAAAMLIFAAAYWGLAFGFLSRRMEQQADLFALETASAPTAFLNALEKLASMTPGGAYRRSISSWRHFSIARRVQFLEAVLADPAQAVRFRRRIGVIEAALFGALALGAARLLIARPELFGL